MKTSWTESTDAAAALLRQASPRAWTIWALCTLPFAYLLGRLLLAASFDAFYSEHAAPLTLAVAAAYLLKQVGEAYFQGELIRSLGAPPPPLRLGPQLALQPTALLVIPLAALLFFPLAPAVTFYRTLSVSSPRQALAHATRAVILQSWELSLLLAAGLLLWINLFALWLFLPTLLRAFFGWETAFGRIENRMFNLPSFWVVSLLTYLVLDPLCNAISARRVFLHEARKSGIDLLAALRVIATALILITPLAAQESREIEQSIQQTQREPGFAFRQPREPNSAEAQENWILRSLRAIGHLIDDFPEWIRPKKDQPPELPSAGLSPQVTQNLLIGLAVVLVLGLGFYLYKNRRPSNPPTVAASALPTPDLTREDVRPDALPEASWLALADDYVARGDYRLALRALHLAGLRRLGERGLITIAATKSGGEYGRELERRSRPQPAVFPLFSANLRRFEEAWYGFHELDPTAVLTVRQRWEEIRSHVG
ncbi:MAG: hypothetical protein NTV52_12535 [Acidobacteria bacterium]|nr:hypothetical protein [Acidobacteriota bacterium]